MDVHYNINFSNNDIITHESRIAELELYNRTLRNVEWTGELEHKNHVLEDQMTHVTDASGHHLGYW